MSAVSKAISEECSALAFYGIQPSANAIETFYHTMVQWFNELGCPPDKLGVTGPGYSDGLASFIRGNAMLQKTGFKKITDVELISRLPDVQNWERSYYLTASYNGRGKNADADVVARSSLATLSPTSMLPLARTLAQALQPAYGIGYRRDHRFGPEWYPGGICMGLGLTGAEREEADSISGWSDGIGDQVWREGLLRDIYPWNFLTRPHLARKVGSVPLERWIQEVPRRGTLNLLCDGVFLWQLTEANIPDVRHVLRQADVIFDSQKDL